MISIQYQLTDIRDEVVYGIVTDPLRDLTKVAHQYFASPGMPCTEMLCPVESWLQENGDWILVFHVTDGEALRSLQEGGQITPTIGSDGLVNFSVTDKLGQSDPVLKSQIVSEPGVCSFCKDQIAAGKKPPYHDNCKCYIQKNYSSEVLKMTNSEIDQLMGQLELISKQFICKSAFTSKADRAVAIAKASRTADGAIIARRILAAEQQEAFALAYPSQGRV